MLFYPLLLLSAPLVAFANTEENIIYRKVVDGPPCNPEPVSDLVPLCSNLGYNHTTFPNYRGLDAKETNEELSDLRTLIRTNCSNAILHLLCSIYAPPCMPAYPGWRYPPCKSLCEYVENGCGAVFKLISGYEWPPNQNLNCSRYTTYEQNHLSFCPPDPTVLQIPQSETEDTSIASPPKNFTATVVSPSTVLFSWMPPENDEHETYYLTCKPHTIPLRTKNTVVTVSHLKPNTSYSCRVLFAHAKNIEELACTVEFTTGVLFPPLSVHTKLISPVKVNLSWKHKDEEHQKRMEMSSYIILCQNQVYERIEETVEGNSLTFNNLRPGTRYYCNISIASTLSEHYETAKITFATQEFLTVTFTENTPAIDGDTVAVKLATNRPVLKMVCQLLNHSPKKKKIDCSDGTAIFHDIFPGSYTLRIVAENDRSDRIVIREKINVPSCAVKLSKITQTENAVTIFFRGTNSANSFTCSLDGQELFECSSPLYLSNYQRGVHSLVVVPTSNWCDIITREELSTTFTI